MHNCTFSTQLPLTKSGEPHKIHKLELFQNAGQAGMHAGTRPVSASDCLMSLDRQSHQLEG